MSLHVTPLCCIKKCPKQKEKTIELEDHSFITIPAFKSKSINFAVRWSLPDVLLYVILLHYQYLSQCVIFYIPVICFGCKIIICKVTSNYNLSNRCSEVQYFPLKYSGVKMA